MLKCPSPFWTGNILSTGSATGEALFFDFDSAKLHSKIPVSSSACLYATLQREGYAATCDWEGTVCVWAMNVSQRV